MSAWGFSFLVGAFFSQGNPRSFFTVTSIFFRLWQGLFSPWGEARAESRDVSSPRQAMNGELRRHQRWPGLAGTGGEQPGAGQGPIVGTFCMMEKEEQKEKKWDSLLSAGGTVPTGAFPGAWQCPSHGRVCPSLSCCLPIPPREGRCWPAPGTTSQSNSLLLS